MGIPRFYCKNCRTFKNRLQVNMSYGFFGGVRTYHCNKCDCSVYETKYAVENLLTTEYVTKHEFECFNTDPYIVDKLDKHIVSVVESMDRNSKQIVPIDLHENSAFINAAIVLLGSYVKDKANKPRYDEMQKAIKTLFSVLSENPKLPYPTIALLKREIATIEDVIEKGPIDHNEPFK